MQHGHHISERFDIRGKVAVVTGGTGVLGGALAGGLAAAGARVSVASRSQAKADNAAAALTAKGFEALGVAMEVTDRASVEAAAGEVMRRWGRVDILVNAAGGNNPKATAHGDLTFFDLPPEALQEVVKVNLLGTIIPSQVFGKLMADTGSGSIVNISSMAAQRPLTRVVGYSAAKAAVDNLTRWLAVHMAKNHGPGIRVNAIAPGFFLTEQNRFLLTKEDGSYTERGQQVIASTPMSRFGSPEELVGALCWLASPSASFVTGVVVPVDGGFSAFGGV